MAGALADIFAAVRLGLDGTGFEAQATALATRSGQNAGTVMGQQLSSKLKSAIGGAAGALGGLAFSAMLNGANELDAATQKLAADTGMTADQAKLAEKAMAGMYQNNLQGFADIGASMAVVVNGLDLTGAAADAMTQKFLTFETATGQDSAAVSAFHEILNAWNLDASAAPGIMDLLTASHQRYGSSVTDNEAALRTLAPQMQALGMDITDTVNLLNLFDAAGMDSSKAMFALNTAVKNLKPGQTLNDLIAQVSSIADPTLRAQKAIELFGARGGVNLANALKPGITSLDQFATSAADTAGATDRAGAAIESSFGNQAVLMLHNFQGALAGVGTDLGQLVMVAALVGPGLTRGVFGIAGAVAGTAFGAALVSAAVTVIAAPASGDAIRGALDNVFHPGQSSGPGFFDQLFSMLTGGNALADHVKSLGSQVGGQLGDAGPSMVAPLEAGLVRALKSDAPSVFDAASGLASALTAPITDSAEAMRQHVIGYLSDVVSAYKTKWSELAGIASGAADAIYGPATRAAGLAANAREQAAQREIIASGKSTKAEIADAKDRLLALQQEGFGIRIEMAGRGELSKTAYAQLVSDLQKQAKSGNEEVAASAALALAELAALKAAAAGVPSWAGAVTRYGGKIAKLPSFDSGSPFVPADMLAVVHRGEIIVPAAPAAAIRAGQASLGGPALPDSSLAGQPAVIRIEIGGRPLVDYVDEQLAYRRRR